MNPQVVHLIMCDAAYADPRNLLRLIVRGVQVRLRARNPPPIRHDFVALVMMIGFTGGGECWVRVVEEATGQRVAESRHRRFRFPPDPDELFSFTFRVTQCPLPRYGQYRLELLLDGRVIAVRPFWLAPKV
jgi:hypothetical protein